MQPRLDPEADSSGDARVREIAVVVARVLGVVLLGSGLARLLGSELPDRLLVDWDLQWPAPRLVGLVELVIGACLLVPSTAVAAGLVGASLLSGAVIIDGFRGEFAALPILLGGALLGVAAGLPAPEPIEGELAEAPA